MRNIKSLVAILLLVFVTISIDTIANRNKTGKVFTFTLTHLLDKKLPTNASFTCGDTPVWVLDFKNGDKIKYTIISGDGSLCGIGARDNLGDNCEICIISDGGGKMTLRLKYSSKATMVFKGYVN